MALYFVVCGGPWVYVLRGPWGWHSNCQGLLAHLSNVQVGIKKIKNPSDSSFKNIKTSQRVHNQWYELNPTSRYTIQKVSCVVDIGFGRFIRYT